MPIEDEGNPTNWTLRFKHGRITILVYSEPLTPFATLKTDLLDTLRERYPSGLPAPSDGIPSPTTISQTIEIPQSIDDVALGVPVDEYDTEKGWRELTLTNGGAGVRDSPKSLELKDESVVAFSFRTGDETAVAEEGRFEVTWPSYEDAYGEGPELDQGVDEKMEEGL